MKRQMIRLSAGLMIVAIASLALAQDADPAPRARQPRTPAEGQQVRPPRPEGDARPPRMVPPLMAALDTNKDGELSAEEIAKASESLAALDKNEDGKIDRVELRPPTPPRGEGQQGRPNRPQGQQNRQQRPGTDRPGRRPGTTPTGGLTT